eukprot:m.148036 g.148036  ORF g.148036 m.148036 type:complete len:892 (+) comp17789_c0_seq1:131-2806(+)
MAWQVCCLAAMCLVLASSGNAAVGGTDPSPLYSVLENTDVNDNSRWNIGYGKGTSAQDCANQCNNMQNCVAISFNGPASPIHDSNCNFKCYVEKLVQDKGEQTIVLRNGTNLCTVPPPPPPPVIANCTGAMPSDWKEQCLRADLFYSPEKTGLMPDIANGYVGMIVGSDAVFAGGLFNGDAMGKFGHASHRARIPAVHVTVSSPTCSITTRHRRQLQQAAPKSNGVGTALDVRNAVFLERRQVDMGSCTSSIDERWYAHATRPSLLVHEITVINSGTADLSLNFLASVSAPSLDLNLQQVTSPVSKAYAATGGNICAEDAVKPNGGNHTNISMVASLPCEIPNGATTCSATKTVGAGTTQTFTYIMSVATSLNHSDTLRAATEALSVAHTDASALYAEHSAAWTARWALGSLAVDGDFRLAQAINASLYVLRSSIRADWPYGLSPGGLTSDGYNGHTFWDQETWMWPPLLILDQPSAQSALQYRWDRRAGAQVKASLCGSPNHAWCPSTYRASDDMLEFPWESAVTGDEVQFSGGKIGQWGEYEQHISGDVSFAARQYYYVTQDKQWLKQVGFPLIFGVASFYAARVEPRPTAVSANDTYNGNASGKYDLNMVMGPDEYAYPVNNSRYTNTVAALAIAAAVELAPVVGASVPAGWSAIAQGLAVDVSPVPPLSGLSGHYHAEYDGYPLRKGAKVKQADAVMLSYPFGVDMPVDVLANDLTWYEPHTDAGGPAMTWAIFAIGWFNTGNYTRAQEKFRRGFDPNVRPPFMVWTETLNGGCTPFLTGAGGFLQSVVFGTSGMRLLTDRLTFLPPPPSATGAGATRMSIHGMGYRGAKLTQHVTETTASYTMDAWPAADATFDLVVSATGARHPLRVGVTVNVPRAQAHYITQMS